MPPKKQTTPPKLSPKDLVLAKMARYPPWPAFIMPANLIPPAVKKAKKKSSPHCVIFIPDGDFYWLTEKALEPLTDAKLAVHLEKVPEQFKKNPKKKKTNKPSNVNEAFVATDGLDFDTFIRNIFDKDDDDEDDDEEDEEDEEEVAEEEDAETSLKEDEEEEDEEEEDEEEEEEEGEDGNSVTQEEAANSKHKIRARKSSTSSISSRNGKRVKQETETPQNKKIKLDKGEEKGARTNGNGSETTPTATSRVKPKQESKPLTEEEKQHQLWLCRIKLQRSLIQRNQPVTPKDTTGLEPPTADELSVARLILYRLEDFPVSVDLLKKTKIHKVLKCILKDEALEYPDSFKLHERCQELLSKWDNIVQSLKLEKSASTSSESEVKVEKPSKPTSAHNVTQEESEISAINNSIIEKKEPEQVGKTEPPSSTPV